jgi:hypothetical protein
LNELFFQITLVIGGFVLALFRGPLSVVLEEFSEWIWSRAARRGFPDLRVPWAPARARLALLVVGISWIVSGILIWFLQRYTG